jgi:dipeptidase
MCDTLVVLGNSSLSGGTLFAKNSDREPNEAQQVVIFPAADNTAAATLKLTYLEIPQVEHTHAVLLCKPFWMWGAEMGANEHGVVIGNEAVFTRLPYDKQPGMTGMDLLRLGLERADSARGALDVIVRLLETYGQGGNCGFTHPFYYHNSFLIADRQEAWVLETAGKQWASERVKDVRTISNGLTIGSEWDLASKGLVETAIQHGWCRKEEEFHFARSYADFLYTTLGDSKKRQACSTQTLAANRGKITPADMMGVLSSHAGDGMPDWSPDRGILGADVCMHAGFGPVRASQSVGSLVSDLSGELPVHWVTGTAAPCTSLFKPVWIDAGLPDLGPDLSGVYNGESLFWAHEMLHRTILLDYPTRMSAIQTEKEELQREFIARAAEGRGKSAGERLATTRVCFTEAQAAEQAWLKQVHDLPVNHGQKFYSAGAWREYNRKACLPIE